ncbi:hypothetical protein AYO21_10694 [Fonsecaea monophora]|uniref:CFEM domain-containing protein n=1 Tax=Fonsecaea monophora TaxID=254056 RepID=A0A177ET14_9EURO|nr:hypothetical protein AYO21_10694 [Fonsecaea monophora]KAH0835269.1 hypothetical protein FOPE_04082 [Fonsecaea pedrosoi]OAG35127.1 hypothetical protein AYO21_10694 [Fonsecaea monophora]
MKTYAVAAAILAAIAAPVLAQDITTLPACAQQPLLEGIGASGCPLTDIACMCNNQAFIDSLLQLIPTLCTPAESDEVVVFAESMCIANGVELHLPSSASTDSGSVTATATATATPTETAVSTASSASSATVSESSVSSETVVSSETSAAATTSAAAETSAEEEPAATSSSEVAQQTDNAAVANGVGLPVVVAVAAGLIAAL